MRRPLSLAALALLPALAACGQAEQAARNVYRDGAISTCQAQAGRVLPGGLGTVDLQGFCTCAVDRFMAGKSLSDLRTPPGPGDFNPVDLAQCAAGSVPGAGTGAAGTGSGAGRGEGEAGGEGGN
jgi:hypothetical protein